MSIQLINHNPDLKKLKDERYNLSIIKNNIVIEGIPYVNNDKKIAFGSIFCSFNLLEENKVEQQDHTVWFTGEHPCDQNGNQKKALVAGVGENKLRDDIVGLCHLSSKPDSGKYDNFYEKMKRYIDILSAPAKSIDPSIRHKNFDYEFYEEDSVFVYRDTNTARAEITSINNKVKDKKIAIIGLGGTGAFILDFISKTPVSEIGLFDGDQLKNHNAFRIPGAVPLDELGKRQSKASYLENIYKKLHTGIRYFEEFIDETNVDLLKEYDFVFIAVDDSKSKEPIVNFLINSQIPFIDVGMGITKTEQEDSLRGQIRKTMVTSENKKYLNKVPTKGKQEDANDIYQQNIQLIELNALNAALAVIEWKKYFGFYNQLDNTYHSLFIIDKERIINGT